jgi:hypothetical protein
MKLRFSNLGSKGVKVPISKMMGEIECKIIITGMKVWKIKRMIAIPLIKFAIGLMGMKANIIVK